MAIKYVIAVYFIIIAIRLIKFICPALLFILYSVRKNLALRTLSAILHVKGAQFVEKTYLCVW